MGLCVTKCKFPIEMLWFNNNFYACSFLTCYNFYVYVMVAFINQSNLNKLCMKKNRRSYHSVTKILILKEYL